MYEIFFGGYMPSHRYTFVEVVDGRTCKSRMYDSRHDAEQAMYVLLGKHRARIVKMYDDKHDKVYFDSTGAQYIISRQ